LYNNFFHYDTTAVLDWIKVSLDNKKFIFEQNEERFAPLGFNYDHDEHYRLLEDYWHDEWEKVVKDFQSMKDLGATVVRVHLQLGKFLLSPHEVNNKEFLKLDALFDLAASMDIYIALVGLGCYHKEDVPDWYTNMDTESRWETQAFFWKNIAQRYADNPVCFCFDLMNEPVVPGRVREPGSWLGAEFAGKCFLQFITLNGTKESRTDTAIRWIKYLLEAIRQYDKKRLVTVGLVDWSLNRPGMNSGFYPDSIMEYIDFISAHLYPETGKPEVMLETLKHFAVGKPVVIDETFHLKCPVEDEEWFLQQARQYAEGFLGFYTDYVDPPQTFHDSERNRAVKQWLGIHKKIAPLYRID